MVTNNFVSSKSCMECICEVESGCRPLDCHNDGGSLSCGYFQIKEAYYTDCGKPGSDWKSCSRDKSCSIQCVKNYMDRYSRNCPASMNACEKMARLHNGGPYGCQSSSTIGYWNKVQKCL
ncbi:destabilase domain-containing protein [Ditylenchus destructor]|nr:destabilase domain-containing protein [Ditylenchus destructor]